MSPIKRTAGQEICLYFVSHSCPLPAQHTPLHIPSKSAPGRVAQADSHKQPTDPTIHRLPSLPAPFPPVSKTVLPATPSAPGLHHPHPRRCHTHPLPHCHLCPSGHCWERWGSCHRHRQMNLYQSFAGPCWGAAGNCPGVGGKETFLKPLAFVITTLITVHLLGAGPPTQPPRSPPRTIL